MKENILFTIFMCFVAVSLYAINRSEPEPDIIYLPCQEIYTASIHKVHM